MVGKKQKPGGAPPSVKSFADEDGPAEVTNTKTLTRTQIKELDGQILELKEASKPPGFFSRLVRLAVFIGICYGGYAAAKSGKLDSVFANVSERLEKIPVLQKIMQSLPKIPRPNANRGGNVADDPDNKDPKKVVQNFNKKIVDYSKQLDAVADGDASPRQPASTHAATAQPCPTVSAVDAPAQLPGKLFPFKVGNKFAVLQSLPQQGDDKYFCKVAEEANSRSPASKKMVYKVICVHPNSASNPEETYYFSREAAL